MKPAPAATTKLTSCLCLCLALGPVLQVTQAFVAPLQPRYLAASVVSASSASSSASFSSPSSSVGLRRRWRPLFQQQQQGDDPSGAFAPVPVPPPPSKTPNYKTIAALVGGELLLGLLAFPLGQAFKVNVWGGLVASAKAAAGVGPLLAVSALLTLPALLLHFASGDEIEEMLKASLEGIFGSETSKKSPLVVIAISVLLSISAGVGEELLFRGALQPVLSNLASSPVAGVAISSFIFAALHAATPRYFLLALLLSVYLGTLQVRYANVLVPIIVHTLFDVVGFLQNHFGDRFKRKPRSA